MAKQVVNEPGIFADNAARRVFDFIVKENAVLDDKIAFQLGLPSDRVVAILGALKQLGLVVINDDLSRGVRTVRATSQAFTLARGLR